jgi:hypothetical protein
LAEKRHIGEAERALQPSRRLILAFSHQRLSEPSPSDAEVPQSMESRTGDPLDQKEGQFYLICLEQVNSYDFLPLYWVARHATLSPNGLWIFACQDNQATNSGSQPILI